MRDETRDSREEETARAGAPATAIDIRDVVKNYGAVRALAGVSLAIRDNEFFTLLGPSGCGKTTLLRLIAGFEPLDGGRILLYGEEIEQLPPDRRPVNTVFQHYALFPHMTVAENVAFGLRRLKRPAAEIDDTVRRMLAMVRLEAEADRRPHQLSGGQQQRVALARALAPAPRVLLLDEPLSALDLKLRQEMRGELQRLQRETGITFVFVTHDQEEALAMSDRIAVMDRGRVQQVGTPEDIYLRPANRFVADFIGDTNFVEAEVRAVADGRAALLLAGGLPATAPAVRGIAPGQRVTVSIRPENVLVSAPAEGQATARVVESTYLGPESYVMLELPGGTRLKWRRSNRAGEPARAGPGEEVGLSLAPDAVAVLTT